jgi:ATP-binding cassette subfamily F protein 3
LVVGNFARLEVDRLDARDTALVALTRRIDRRARPVGRAAAATAERIRLSRRPLFGPWSTSPAAACALAPRSSWRSAPACCCSTSHQPLRDAPSLITALQEFAGAVIVVSHDRGLLRSVCDQFWLVSDGVVRDFDSDLEDYAAG